MNNAGFVVAIFMEFLVLVKSTDYELLFRSTSFVYGANDEGRRVRLNPQIRHKYLTDFYSLIGDEYLKNTDSTKVGLYKSRRIDSAWSSYHKIKLAVFQNGKEDIELTFNNYGANKTNWFSRERLISTSLGMDGMLQERYDMFSLLGDDGRMFQIGDRRHNCETDAGWLMVTDVGNEHERAKYNACDYEVGHAKFLYSPVNGKHHYVDAERGNLLVIFGIKPHIESLPFCSGTHPCPFGSNISARQCSKQANCCYSLNAKSCRLKLDLPQCTRPIPAESEKRTCGFSGISSLVECRRQYCQCFNALDPNIPCFNITPKTTGPSPPCLQVSSPIASSAHTPAINNPERPMNEAHATIALCKTHIGVTAVLTFVATVAVLLGAFVTYYFVCRKRQEQLALDNEHKYQDHNLYTNKATPEMQRHSSKEYDNHSFQNERYVEHEGDPKSRRHPPELHSTNTLKRKGSVENYSRRHVRTPSDQGAKGFFNYYDKHELMHLRNGKVVHQPHEGLSPLSGGADHTYEYLETAANRRQEQHYQMPHSRRELPRRPDHTPPQRSHVEHSRNDSNSRPNLIRHPSLDYGSNNAASAKMHPMRIQQNATQL